MKGDYHSNQPAGSNSTPTSSLSEFSIDLEEAYDGCYRPGQIVSGNVVIGVSSATSAPVEIVSLKLRFCGGAKIKCKVKGMDSNSEQAYLKEDIELLSEHNEPIIIGVNKHVSYFGFEKKLKDELYTSVESKSASIFYCIRAYCIYRTQDNQLKSLNAVRGISVVENFDLNDLPSSQYFEPAVHNLLKKFGLFSCTGGHIKLNFSLCRSAFVCGENITIKGRIENKTDRRVDKVAAVLQQVVVIYGNINHSKDSELNLLDVSDIHEDNLALFVDEGASVKIERNFALPPLPPSTYTLDECEAIRAESSKNGARRRRISLSMSRLSFSSSRSPPMLNQPNHRFLKVLYQLSVRVKTGGVEVMEINVPIVIGALPHDDHQKKVSVKKCGGGGAPRLMPQSPPSSESASHAASIIYLQNRKEAPVCLIAPNELYICSKNQLNYANKYPYFVDLPGSSKQSRKVSLLAKAMKAETSVGNKTQSDVKNEQSAKKGGEHSFEIYSKPVAVRSQSGHRKFDDCTARMLIDRPCRHLPASGAANNGMPPVEILITDHKAEHIQSIDQKSVQSPKSDLTKHCV